MNNIINCPECEAENLINEPNCEECGAVLRIQGDSTGGLIPYKNPHALIAYYCGVFSIIPALGLILGIAGFALGIIGLKKRKQNPLISGVFHAWVGIGCGGLFALVWACSAWVYLPA